MPETETRRYRFGPLERRGLIGSLRATQVIPMAVSLAAAVVLMRTLPSVAAHTRRLTLGRHLRASAAPAAGVRVGESGRPEPVVDLPEAAQGLEVLAAPFRGEMVGVVKDPRTKTYTATIAVRVTSFGLLDRSEQETRQAGWGSVLASLSREGTPVSRVPWL